MQFWAVLVLLVGLALRWRTTVVVLLAAAVAALGSGQSLGGLLETLGSAFVDNRSLTLFLLTLPAVATAERYGLRQWVAAWALGGTPPPPRPPRPNDLGGTPPPPRPPRPGHVLFGYQCFRVLCGVLGLRLNGHPTLVRPLLAPMACAEAAPQERERVKAGAAASENYGNFYGQNLSPVGGGVLMVFGLLKGMGYHPSLWRLVAFATLPALACLGLAWLQFRTLKTAESPIESPR